MIHPLLIPNVLETIMEYLSIKEVEICREVCSQWNYEGMKSLQQRKLIKIQSLDSLLSYTTTFSIPDNEGCTFCHCNFQLNFHFQENDIPIVNQFFIQFSTNIKLLNVIMGNEFFQGKQLGFILEVLENLETLQLNLSYSFDAHLELGQDTVLPSIKHIAIDVSGYDSVVESATSLLRDLFSMAINLNTISYLGVDAKKRTPSKLKSLLTDIILEVPTEHLRKLSHLKYLMKLTENKLHTLISKQFPLRTLYLDLWNNSEETEEDICVSSASLVELMNQLAPTLTIFVVDFPWRKDVSYFFHFPVFMTQLHSLTLSGIEGSLLKLFHYLPQLQILEISQLDLEEAFPRNSQRTFGENSTSMGCCAQMNTLKLEYCTNQSSGVIRRISRLFPTLKQLNITHICNDVTRAIYKEMPGLLYLYMHGNSLNDEGICGIPEQISKEENLTDYVHLDSYRQFGASLRRYSYIADLTELRRLELDSHLITDISVVYGIVDCKNLNHLILNYSELTELSITAFERKWGRTRSYESEHRIVI